MRLVQFTDHDAVGEEERIPLWINPEFVVALRPSPLDKVPTVRLDLTSGHHYNVIESLETVLERLGVQDRWQGWPAAPVPEERLVDSLEEAVFECAACLSDMGGIEHDRVHTCAPPLPPDTPSLVRGRCGGCLGEMAGVAQPLPHTCPPLVEPTPEQVALVGRITHLDAEEAEAPPTKTGDAALDGF